MNLRKENAKALNIVILQIITKNQISSIVVAINNQEK